ncbi:DUF4350 domain-containing protein [Streptomyces sp. JNUCC 64]
MTQATAPPAPSPAPATTSLAPTARQRWRRVKGPLIALVAVLVTVIVVGLLGSGTARGRLDPRSAEPTGSRAVSALLAERGVTTRVITTLDEAVAATGPDTTLLVARPDYLDHAQQRRLRAATEDAGGRTVLVAPGATIGILAPGVTSDPDRALDKTLTPQCRLPAAERAGDADTGLFRYRVTAPGALTCYPDDGLPTLVQVPEPRQDGATAGTPPADTVVVGAPDLLYNDRLDEHGNASLALGLLGSRPHLVWYLPSLTDASPDRDDRSFAELIPSGWLWGTLQLVVAMVVVALWRGRRFGPLVPERLPVVIRASETTEGRARLYRRAGARDRAAATLRAATRTRLAPLLGVPPSRAHTPESLLPALAARTARAQPPGSTPADPHALLFGPPPDDDAALLTLTDQLDALEREVRAS